MIKKIAGIVFVLAVFFANVFFPSQFEYLSGLLDSGKAVGAQQAVKLDDEIYDFGKLDAAITDRRSKIWLEELPYRVTTLLPDDNHGSRHQRFIVKPEGLPRVTLLVAHNIDIADSVPVEKGDQVFIKGRYEWNDKGGVIHWTHHDPKAKKVGGWIRVGAELYR